MAFNQEWWPFVGRTGVVRIVRCIEQTIRAVPIGGRKLNGFYRR